MSNVPINFVKHVIFDDDNITYENNAPYNRALPPGSASWISDCNGKECAALDFTCPCGCGRVNAISVCTIDKKQHEWLWNGNVEKPTLTPSILNTAGCRWHGYLTDGIFKSC